jgi:hypothetical protein
MRRSRSGRRTTPVRAASDRAGAVMSADCCTHGHQPPNCRVAVATCPVPVKQRLPRVVSPRLGVIGGPSQTSPPPASPSSTNPAPGELLCGTLGTDRPGRVHRPDADLRRGASADGAASLRGALQREPAAPVPAAAATRSRRVVCRAACRAGAASEGARRRDQRVPSRRVSESPKPAGQTGSRHLERYRR